MIRPKSSLKLSTYSGMPSNPATRRASAASRTEQQPCLLLPEVSQSVDEANAAANVPVASDSACPPTPSGVPSRMNTPTTSYPSRNNSAAATDESTPPDMATTTLGRGEDITPYSSASSDSQSTAAPSGNTETRSRG